MPASMPSFVVPALGLVLMAAGCGGRSYLQSARALPPGTSRVTVSAALTGFQLGNGDVVPTLRPELAVRRGLAPRLEMSASVWTLGGALGIKAQPLGRTDDTGVAVAVGAGVAARRAQVASLEMLAPEVVYSEVIATSAEATLVVSGSGPRAPFLVVQGVLDRAYHRGATKYEFNPGLGLGLAGPRWSFEFGVIGDGLIWESRGHLALGRSF